MSITWIFQLTPPLPNYFIRTKTLIINNNIQESPEHYKESEREIKKSVISYSYKMFSNIRKVFRYHLPTIFILPHK
ncbi:hypothetical protein LSO9J_10030 [Candidatus Liberibacter solanacearum]